MNAARPGIAWQRLALEGAVIIVSILLAFGIDAWWEEHKDRMKEQEILVGLQEEFHLTRELLANAMETLSERVLTLEALLIAIDVGSPAKELSISDDFMQAMLAPSTTDLGSGALDALLNSGRVELLENKSLRAKLAAWNGVLGEVNDDEQNNSQFIYEQLIPYFIRNSVPVSGPMSLWYESWAAPKRSIADNPEAFARLLQDSEFRVMTELFHGYMTHGIGEFEAALDAIDEILAEIQKSLN